MLSPPLDLTYDHSLPRGQIIRPIHIEIMTSQTDTVGKGQPPDSLMSCYDQDEHYWKDGSGSSSAISGNDYTDNNGSSDRSTSKGAGLIQQLSLKERQDVWTWKFLVVSTMFLCAGFLSSAARGFLRRRQQQEFRAKVSGWIQHYVRRLTLLC